MKFKLIKSLCFMSLIVSCDSSTMQNQNDKTVSQSDTSQPNSTKTTKQIEESIKTTSNNLKPVFGYRFILTGDFDGDGSEEKLIEHFVSGVDSKETNKFYEG